MVRTANDTSPSDDDSPITHLEDGNADEVVTSSVRAGPSAAERGKQRMSDNSATLHQDHWEFAPLGQSPGFRAAKKPRVSETAGPSGFGGAGAHRVEDTGPELSATRLATQLHSHLMNRLRGDQTLAAQSEAAYDVSLTLCIELVAAMAQAAHATAADMQERVNAVANEPFALGHNHPADRCHPGNRLSLQGNLPQYVVRVTNSTLDEPSLEQGGGTTCGSSDNNGHSSVRVQCYILSRRP